MHQPANSVSPHPGGLTPLPLAVSWRLSSWGKAVQPPAFPHRSLSRQQVRPDYWGVCWRLHPDAADPNTPDTPECSRKQEQGPNRTRDAESWEGKERGGKHATTEGLLRFERMTDKPQYSLDVFVRGNVEEHSKGVNPHAGPWWKNHSRARAAAFHFLNDSDRKSRNLKAA